MNLPSINHPAGKPLRPVVVLALVSSVACLWMPHLWAALAWSVLAVLMFLAGGGRSRRLVAGGLSIAVLLNLAGAVSSAREAGAEVGLAGVGAAYSAFWRNLEEEATTAVSRMSPPQSDRDVVDAFQTMSRLAEASQPQRKALLLVNPGGEVVAWAGVGLLHQPTGSELPAAGASFVQSFTAATALFVVPLEDGPRPWRVVVGRSLAGQSLPFAAPRSPAAHARWALRPPGNVALDGEVVFPHAGAPSLVVDPASARGVREPRAWPMKGAAITLGLMLVAFGVAVSERRAGRRGRLGLVPVVFASAAAAFAVAINVDPHLGLAWVLATGLGTVGVTVRLGAGESHRSAVWSAAAGAVSSVLLALGAWLLQREIGARTLGDDFFGGGDWTAIVLRLTWLLAALGLLSLAAIRHREPVGEGTAWSAAGALLAAAALHDQPWFGLPLAALGGALVTLWMGGLDRPERRPAAAGLGLLLVALLAAASWETAYRLRFRQEIGNDLIQRLGPPTAAELSRFNIDLDDFFDGYDLRDLEPPGVGPTGRDDLAFALWRRSPLAARDSLSALIVEPPSGVSSLFSFDLPLDPEEQPIPGGAGLRLPQVSAWTGNQIEGHGRIRQGSEPWGTVRYWLFPRPGFRLAVSEADELETELLRGRPHRRPADGLPDAVEFALYREDGSVVESPWPQTPPLEPAILERRSGLVETPDGRSWYWTRPGRDGVTVLYLTCSPLLSALARTGTHALGTAAVVAVLLLLSLAFAAPRRAAMGALEATVRSYARRLMLVYTVLLFLPLLALNLILLRNVAERLRLDQLAEGEAALDSARTVLVDYIRGLEDGLSFDLLANRQLVEWLSRIVDHQVYLYWNGQLVGSSQQALVTAGLLPGRVPGDIYARLAYLGFDRELRSRERDDLTYLELYAPAKVAGTTPFILSVPLLEQQEEAARLIARLRRQAALISAGLFVVLVALGGRLARSFTDPLNQLVEGTRRIAGGASSLDLAPRELELSALVQAIDDMAGRIADGRNRLLREKQVIERMVESITSGVVSLDREQRVLLHNSVAAERLGTQVGVGIVERLVAQPHLEKVLAFVTGEDPACARQTTIRLYLPGESEPREWTLVWVPVPGGGDPSALLVVDDDTEVLRGQRLEAWAEMARIIAHEIKNPLTPIRLSAEHMRQVYHRDPERFSDVLERCTDNILRQVEELRLIASEFSTYSRIPRASLVESDLVRVMADLVAVYQDAGEEGGVAVTFDGPREPMLVRLDPTLFTRAVRNLIENALRASAGKEKSLEIEVIDRPEKAIIEVRDRGPGVPEELLARIFEPYFSTHDSGTGLGLPITRRIIQEHEGTIEARNRSGGGLVVAITMPRRPAENTASGTSVAEPPIAVTPARAPSGR